MVQPRLLVAIAATLALSVTALAQERHLGWTEADVQNNICTHLTDSLAHTNAIGATMDGVAFEGMEAKVDCAAKRFAFTLTVSEAVRDRAPDVLDHVANILVRTICAKSGWERVFELGWTVSSDFIFDGRAIVWSCCSI